MRTIRDCKVCVVGGAGFLGSHLVNHLLDDRNCKVLVVDNLVAGRREFIHQKADFLHHDIIGSEGYLYRALRGVDYVFNYAAYPYIPDSFARPIHVCDVNFMGAMKVINTAQEAECKGILQVSSAEIYGDAGEKFYKPLANKLIGIGEDALVVPHSSYGAAKAAIDAWIQVRWREAKTPCIALRQFNCVGERETHPYVIPTIISQLSAQEKEGSVVGYHVAKNGKGVVFLGNNSSRDFLYAGDQARIAVELLECGEFGEVYNLGSESSIKIYDLAKMIGKLMGFSDVNVIEDLKRKRPWEIWALCSDNTKIKKYTRDFEITPLETALKKTIDWYNERRYWPWETRR